LDDQQARENRFSFACFYESVRIYAKTKETGFLISVKGENAVFVKNPVSADLTICITSAFIRVHLRLNKNI